jgi:hypothetical protein
MWATPSRLVLREPHIPSATVWQQRVMQKAGREPRLLAVCSSESFQVMGTLTHALQLGYSSVVFFFFSTRLVIQLTNNFKPVC